MTEKYADNFHKKLAILSERNWKVRNILRDCGGYENCSLHVRALIDKEIEKMEAI
jgi:hypothetical protein